MLLDFDAKKGEAAAAELGDNAAFYKVDVSDYDSVAVSTAPTILHPPVLLWRRTRVPIGVSRSAGFSFLACLVATLAFARARTLCLSLCHHIVATSQQLVGGGLL